MAVVTGTVRVLIVDDQEPFRDAARMVVDLTEGFEVAGTADSGEAGVRLALELRPDLVLMDVKMPGMDGLEATRTIISAEPGIRVVVLSTYDAGELEEPALAAGAIAFVSKSEFGPDRLASVWTTSG